MRTLEAISFLWYFVRLRLNVALGQYYTANPIDIRWRWRYYQHLQQIEHRRHRVSNGYPFP